MHAIHTRNHEADELLGEFIEVDKHQHGKSVGEITEVTDDSIVVEEFFSGETYTYARDTILEAPLLGQEYDVYWREHRNGRGEWVKTAGPFSHHGYASRYYGEYTGHESTRITKESYIHGLEEYGKYNLRSRGGELHSVFMEMDDFEVVDGLVERLKENISVPETHTTLGWVMIHRDTGEVGRVYVRPEFRAWGKRRTNPFTDMESNATSLTG